LFYSLPLKKAVLKKRKKGAKKRVTKPPIQFFSVQLAAFSLFLRPYFALKIASNQKVFHIPPFSAVSLAPSAFRPFFPLSFPSAFPQ
jgi:hypothetical protein